MSFWKYVLLCVYVCVGLGRVVMSESGNSSHLQSHPGDIDVTSWIE